MADLAGRVPSAELAEKYALTPISMEKEAWRSLSPSKFAIGPDDQGGWGRVDENQANDTREIRKRGAAGGDFSEFFGRGTDDSYPGRAWRSIHALAVKRRAVLSADGFWGQCFRQESGLEQYLVVLFLFQVLDLLYEFHCGQLPGCEAGDKFLLQAAVVFPFDLRFFFVRCFRHAIYLPRRGAQVNGLEKLLLFRYALAFR